MFGFLKKALRLYMDIYGRPGTGVTVYTTPDSVIDFYRMSNAQLPLDPAQPASKPRKRARRVRIWGGQGAAHPASFCAGGARGPKSADC